MILTRIVLLSMLTAIVLFSSGCISPPEEKSDNLTTLRIGYQPTTHHLAEMIAQANGWWQEDLRPFGIKEIKEYGYPSGRPELEAMQAGDLDIIYVCTSPFIRPASMGLDAKVVAAVDINGSDLILRNDLEYTGPKSLQGLHIATLPPGTGQDTLLRVWLKDNGVNISEVNITAMGPGDAVKAMLDGDVDGVFLPQPAGAVIEQALKGRSVITSGEIKPNHACCALIVSGRLIRDHPLLVEQIVKTHINATGYLNSNPKEAAKIYSNRTGQDLRMVEYSIETWDGKWVTDPHLLINDTLYFAGFQYASNYTQKEMGQGDLFDTSFYDKMTRP